METLTYKGVRIDERFLERLNQSLSEINAFEYHKFLNDDITRPCSIMDLIFELDRNTTYVKQEEDILQQHLPLDEQFKLVEKFFSHFGLGEKVKCILEQQDPNYKVTISSDAPESRVGHHGHETTLEFDVSSKPTIKSSSTIAHELGHALSAQHTETIKLTQKLEKTKTLYGPNSPQFLHQRSVYREFIDQKNNFSLDAIGEIESHILEKLYVYDLLSKGIISKKDLEDYLIFNRNSFKLNLELILQENDILHQFGNPVTIEDIRTLYLKSEKSNRTDVLAKRLFVMQERAFDNKYKNKHSKHMLRYVIGEIVSVVWIDKYFKSNITEQKEMLKTLKSYLTKTHKLDLDESIQYLLGKEIDLQSLVSEYINLQISKQNLA